MTDNNQPVSPLRQRMIEDMQLRKLDPKTQRAYIRAVEKFTRVLGRSPDAANAEDLRRFQLHLASIGTSHATINATLTGLRFFFEMTLDRPEAMRKTSQVHPPRKLPVVLSIEEVTRLLAHAPGLKYQAALALAYGSGLRAGEVAAIKVSDVDSERMVIRIEQGKGRRDRYALLSPSLLRLLRAWRREAH
jgi:integrase